MNRLKDLREREGLTQEVLADKVGISKSHMSKLERGERDINGISYDLANKFAAALQLPVISELYEEKHMPHVTLLDRDLTSVQACGVAMAIMDFLTGGPNRRGGKLSMTVIDTAPKTATVENVTGKIIAKFQAETHGKYQDSNDLRAAIDAVDLDHQTPRGQSAGAEYIAYYKSNNDLDKVQMYMPGTHVIDGQYKDLDEPVFVDARFEDLEAALKATEK